MIIQALNQLYHRYTNDADIEIPRDGFSIQPIAFEIILEIDGSLHAIQPTSSEKSPKRFTVLGDTKPSGAGINPCFLWDNPVYLLGVKVDDPKPDRTSMCFEAFRDTHQLVQKEIDSPEFSAVCKFLNVWKPSPGFIAELPQEIVDAIQNSLNGNGFFRIRNSFSYVHQAEAVVKWWASRPDKKKWWEVPKTKVALSLGQCSVTGETNVPIARLHEPKIKGVRGTNMAGASVVSFNETAYNSYGLEQSRNASISEPAAFAYCNALNRLLSREAGRKIQAGDTTLVYWSEKPTLMEDSFAAFLATTSDDADEPVISEVQSQSNLDKLEPEHQNPSESLSKNDAIGSTLKKIIAGQYANELGDPDTKFFLLGLSPNAGRISVRSWSVESLGRLVQNIGQHYCDFSIVHSPREPDFPSIKSILKQTVRDSKDIPDLLVGALFRSVIHGYPYPMALFAAVVRRILADREINGIRAGLLKATLNRNSRSSSSPLQKEILMNLEADRPETAYQLGRLFASLERNQRDALGERLNSTIKDRYYGSASSTPGIIFPRLIRLSQHHLANLEGGHRIHAEKRMQEIMARITEFPRHLSLPDQGLFAIGYYHQVQDFFTKKDTSSGHTVVVPPDSN